MLETLQSLLIEYPVIAPVVFVLARMVPIVIAPVPGLAVDIIGIAIFGWVYGLVLGMIAVVCGSAIAFLLARKFREPMVRRFAPLKTIHEWEQKISTKKKFFSLLILHMITSPFFDYVSYTAGLTTIPFFMYMLSTFLGTLPLMIGVYYFGGLSIHTGPLAIGAFILGLIALLSIWKWVVKGGTRE